MCGLTPSKEDYLKTIYLLTRGGESACVTDIAAQMSVTKASTSRAVSDLEKLGLLSRVENRRVYLTNEGIEQAYKIISSYEIIYLFFVEILHMDQEISRVEACKLEHTLSDASLHAMRYLLLKTKNKEKIPAVCK